MKKKYYLPILCSIAVVTASFFYPISKQQPDLSVVGYVDKSQGLGRQSVELIEAFSDEFHVNFIPTSNPKKRRGLFKKIRKVKPNWGKVVIFEDMLWAPGLQKYKAIQNADKESLKIAYTMWESTRLPKEWTHILNTCFDMAVVPAPFLVDTYINSGVTIPVFCVPLGLNLDPFFESPVNIRSSSPFTFGNFSVCSERKNHITLINAFAKAFGNDPEVKLRLNCRLGEKDVSARITMLISQLNLDNIEFTQFNYTPEEYLELFKGIDCYVSPSKGEGFSIQPREAMALGIPVIATSSTGQIPICESNLIQNVPTSFAEPAIFPWGNCYGQYFGCSVDALADAMVNMKTNHAQFIAQQENMREWVSQYRYEKLKPLYRTMIKPDRVLLGETNSIEGGTITTSSEILLKKYQSICENL